MYTDDATTPQFPGVHIQGIGPGDDSTKLQSNSNVTAVPESSRWISSDMVSLMGVGHGWRARGRATA